eukprot:m.358265 g.358265  ORF g.358265 m.358265 type:complete len:297 (+) comp18094_c0_seq1:299-1189(+)
MATWFVTGASGFVGKAFVNRVLSRGDSVIGLSRKAASGLSQLDPRVQWISTVDQLKSAPSHILNLAGEPIASEKWTEARKQTLRDSRIKLTSQLCTKLKTFDTQPKVFISGSAVGYYGYGTAPCTEASPAADGFASKLCVDWENAVDVAPETRAVKVRIGVVLGPNGGMLEKIWPMYKFGLGGRMGSGDQILSWIHLQDLVEMFVWAADNSEVTNALNGTAPNPVPQYEFAQSLGRTLGRPAFIPTPEFVFRFLLGETADLLVKGQSVVPAKAEALGFKYRFTALDDALADIAAKQ